MGYWCGTCGMARWELEWLTLREIFAVFDGYDRRVLEGWKQVRFLGFVVALSSPSGAKNIKRPEQLLALRDDVPWTGRDLVERIDKMKKENEDEEVEEIVRWLNKGN